MIEKQDFYHGATIIRLLEDVRCKGVIKSDSGYLINGTVEIYPKYTTKSRSPWMFTFKQNEIERMGNIGKKVIIAFVCGGDGICALTLSELRNIFRGEVGCISIKRGFHEQYGVSGPLGQIMEKIHFNRINTLVFENNK